MKNPHKKVDQQLAVIAVVVALIAGVLLYFFGGPKADAATKPPRLACFPVMLWDADPGARPCHQIVSVEEDGSGRLELGTARRAIYGCVIPNVREQRGAFTIKCRRLSK